MKHILLVVLFTTVSVSQSWIRINQLGYTPHAIKNAVLVSKDRSFHTANFCVRDALTNNVVFTSEKVTACGGYGPFSYSFRLDFSELDSPGAYYVEIDSVRSPNFKIDANIYNGSADFLLNYMRQQRSGYNPSLMDSCHTHDGFIIYHPTLDSTHIDVAGGWHDASDYLQYVTTSATAAFQLLFSFDQHPHAFNDLYGANGIAGANGIPDVLDEAKWGLDWLVKMNPSDGSFFNQIADDRDHRGFRLPTEDTVQYGKGKERPVYYINGTPQGIYQYKNRTTGVASSVAKFASAFALGSTLLKEYYPEFSRELKAKAIDAYAYAKKYPGVCQTAPCRAPYFYEEANWADDMELAAAQLFAVTHDRSYRADAVSFGRKEPITPWLGADTAKHYEWYPFVNLGHYLIAEHSAQEQHEFADFYRAGIEKVYRKGETNPFRFGVPFIWCSNNLVSSLLTQIHLYRALSNDHRYDSMEAALRDWLLGCNPWGTSMIVGFPRSGDSPSDPHSALTHVYGRPIDGGLVDGPVYRSIYNAHKKYISVNGNDEYAQFQSDLAVYHDFWGDYTSNEPTMDGTAGLTMYLSSLEHSTQPALVHSILSHGAIIRFDTTQKNIYLAFTGHEFADGAETIMKALKRNNVKASFFFTGDFYRSPSHSKIITALRKAGHYLGGHSDAHVLYAPWEHRDSLLVTKREFFTDLKNNYTEMAKFGISKKEARFFLPPYEWYNQTIADWTDEAGLTLVNFTPGTSSNADYTTPDMKNYVPADTIAHRILAYERRSSSGLKGFILLSHFGTDPSRTEKFYSRLDALIKELRQRGYTFKRL